MMEKIWKAILKVTFAMLGFLILMDAIIRSYGEFTFLALLAGASVVSYLYRERGRPKNRTTRPVGSFERRRLDADAVDSTNAHDSEESSWT